MRKCYMLVFTLVFAGGVVTKTMAQAAASLPVVLVDFNAETTVGNTIHITWTTRQQVNTDCFDLEKSNDAISWQRIGRMPSTGNSANPVSYEMKDLFPLKGINYYRLCIRDLNGAFGYTKVRSARVNISRNTIVYPNPAAELVTVLLAEIPRADWQLTLFNSMGQVVIQRRFARTTTTVRLPINNYVNGTYTLEINDGFSSNSNKLMINHQ